MIQPSANSRVVCIFHNQYTTNMKSILSALISIFPFFIQAQDINWQWLKVSENNANARFSFLSQSNNRIITGGSTFSNINFGESSLSCSNETALLYCMDVSGNLLWNKALHSDVGATLLDVDFMSDDSFVALVHYRKNLTVNNVTIETNNADTFFSDNHAVIRFDSNGEIIWWKNTAAASSFGKLAISPQDEIIMSGHCVDTLNFITSETIETLDSVLVYTPSGESFWQYFHEHWPYISKLDSNGNLLWIKDSDGFVNDIKVNDNGQIFVTGFYHQIAAIQNQSFSNYGTETGFISRFDSNGNLQWLRRVGGSANDNRLQALQFDPQGNVYVTGSVLGNNVQIENFDTLPWSEHNAFIGKLNDVGDFIWYRILGEDDVVFEEPNYNSGLAMSYGDNGMYVTGYFSNHLVADMCDLWNDGAHDLFVLHINDNGYCNYGRKHVTYGWNEGNGISFLDGDLFISGYTYLENWSSAFPSYALIGKISAENIVLNNFEFKTNASFEVYPNPCSNYLSFDVKERDKISYRIFDNSGRVLRDGDNRSNQSIYVGDLPNGNYHIMDKTSGIQRSFIKN